MQWPMPFTEFLNYNGLSNFFKKYGKEEVENLKWENSAHKVKEIYDQIVKIIKIIMRTICLYFQVHQPFRFRRYRFFDIGNEHYYYDDYTNESILRKVADKCYLPANKITA